MQTIILLITAFTVSLDSFFCGLSLAIKSTNYKKIILGIALSVFCLCYLGSTLGHLVSEKLQKTSKIIGGTTLMLIAILDSLQKSSPTTMLLQSKNDDIFIKSLIVGFSIGIDGAIGCFFLALTGINSLLVATLVTFMHILLLLSAFSLSKIIKIKNISVLEKIPTYIIFILGVYKLL